MQAVVAAAVGACAVQGQGPDSSWVAFQQHVRDFGRHYSDVEMKSHFAVFAENLAYIQAENDKNNSHTLAINEFADMTEEEFESQKLGYIPSSRRWGALGHLGVHQPSNLTLPTYVDYRKVATTPVKNQGTCGSCWSFSVAGALEGAWALAGGELVSLSTQQMVSCFVAPYGMGKPGCGGAYRESVFEFEETVNICTDASYPYVGRADACRTWGCSVAIPAHGVTGYKDVSARSEPALMGAVLQQPTSVLVGATDPIFRLYGGGVLNGACRNLANHAILAVGYTPGYWIVKNSWGYGWGEQGYAYIARGTGGSGMCGILAAPSYPVVRRNLDGGSVESMVVNV